MVRHCQGTEALVGTISLRLSNHSSPIGPVLPLTRIGLTERLKLAVQSAAKQFPELAKRRVFPHLIRHSVAMHMLHSQASISRSSPYGSATPYVYFELSPNR